jgi:hypothetical protein
MPSLQRRIWVSKLELKKQKNRIKMHTSDQNKWDNFEKYVRRQSLARFLVRYELFKLQMPIKGSIIECGVHYGGGLMAWAKLSADLEPYALDRLVIGIDTFEGFPSVDDKDLSGKENAESKVGGFNPDYDVYAEMKDVIDQYDQNRFLNQFKKVQLVKGDAVVTIPQLIKDQPHLLISLLFLDFDLYEPTRVALQQFLPRMSKGAILAFDEINNPWWPGETQALLENLNIRNYEIRRFSFDPSISYIVL